MAGKQHLYRPTLSWTGNQGAGTRSYTAYSRDHVISVEGRPDILASSDPAFRGDGARYNPEDMLVASLAACHMLWYLHLASDAGIVVVAYADTAEGTMVEDRETGGRFVEVTLRPLVTIGPGSDLGKAEALHAAAHRKCFIANSVNFPVHCRPTTAIA